MPKQQINIKLPPELIEALKLRATEEGMTLTDLIQGFCEQGLGLPTSSTSSANEVYERIVTEIDERIPKQVDERIANQLVSIQEKLAALELALGETVA